MTPDARIEAILFFKAEPVTVARLSEIIGIGEEETISALHELEQKLSGRGVTLIRHNDAVSLGTVPEASEMIDVLAKDELSRELGKSALETLTIVLYKSPIAKPEIDYIRGVNSNYILRNLLVRGLVEKYPNPEDQRSFLYRPTMAAMGYLGISKLDDLPEYETFRGSAEAAISEGGPEEIQNNAA